MGKNISSLNFKGIVFNTKDIVNPKPGDCYIIQDEFMCYDGKEFIKMCNPIISEDTIILNFIESFTKSNKQIIVDLFSKGHCYWFAQILKTRFNGEIVYDPIANHFACKIDGCIYDITGKLDNKDNFTSWDLYKSKDENEIDRIYRDCIFKLPYDYPIDYENHKCDGIYLRLKEDE